MEKPSMTVAATGGLRDNRFKLPYSVVHESVLAAISEITHKSSIPGGGKYPMWNYKKGLPMTEVADSALRHLFKWLRGENIDGQNCPDCSPEKPCTKHSGLHHLKHALWNAALLVEQLETHPELDNRFKPEDK